jgi:hypothetical protein
MQTQLTPIPMSYEIAFPTTRPDPIMTPGSVDARVTPTLALTSAFTKGYWRGNTWVPWAAHQLGDIPVRNVPVELAHKVWKNYYGNMSRKAYPHRFEMDHLIPLVFGGTNHQDNLWPQPSTVPPFNSGAKDALEVLLISKLADVVQHQGGSQGADYLYFIQNSIATDWIAFYKTFPNDLPALMEV